MSSPQPSPSTDLIGDALARVSREFEDVVDVPVWSMDDQRLDARMGAALAAKAAAEELVARVASEMDARDVPGRNGSRSLHSHLVARYRLSGAEAKRITAAATQLHGSGPSSAVTELVRRAQACGVVSAEQAVVIATAINRAKADNLACSVDTIQEAQTDLIGYAGQLPLADLQRLSNHLVEVVAPDRADVLIERQLRAAENAHYGSAELTIHRKPDGSSDGRWTDLPAVATAILTKALDAYAAPRRSHTHGDSERLDHRVDTTPEQLPYPQRRARAFCELLEHVPADGLPSHGTTNATIVVTIDETKLRVGCGEATLDTAVSLSAGEARRLACNAALLPMVLDGQSRILDLGSSRRLFDCHQRLALAHRDRGCVFPTCDRPPSWCEAHHAIPWSRGGPSDLANGMLLCCFHHHLIHQGDWTMQMSADQIPEAIPPPWFDDRTPIRHPRFRPRARPG